MILSSTFRYRKKYITTVLYKPIWHKHDAENAAFLAYLFRERFPRVHIFLQQLSVAV